MEWQSFFIGMGAMFGLILVVFFVMPGRKMENGVVRDMEVLHEFWRQSIEISTASQKHFESIAKSLAAIRHQYIEEL